MEIFPFESFHVLGFASSLSFLLLTALRLYRITMLSLGCQKMLASLTLKVVTIILIPALMVMSSIRGIPVIVECLCCCHYGFSFYETRGLDVHFFASHSW